MACSTWATLSSSKLPVVGLGNAPVRTTPPLGARAWRGVPPRRERPRWQLRRNKAVTTPADNAARPDRHDPPSPRQYHSRTSRGRFIGWKISRLSKTMTILRIVNERPFATRKVPLTCRTLTLLCVRTCVGATRTQSTALRWEVEFTKLIPPVSFLNFES